MYYKMKNIVDPRLLQPSICFEVESVNQVLGRYQWFGKELIKEIIAHECSLARELVFLKYPGSKDIWAFCNNRSISLGFQIDPDCEVIIVWRNEKDFIEYGVWSSNPVKEAMATISRIYNETT